MDTIDTAEHTEDVISLLIDRRLRAPDALRVLQFAVDQLLTLSDASIDEWISGLRLIHDTPPTSST